MPVSRRLLLVVLLLVALLHRDASFKQVTPAHALQRQRSGTLRVRREEPQHTTRLQMSLLPTLASASAVAGVIAFHEAGHFLAAKVQGMKVQSYNIGYGPKLFSFNDSVNTEFALRAIPLGGYVAFPMNVELDEDGEVVKELTDPDLLQNRPPLERAFVISAGVMANILLSFLLASGTALTTGVGHPTYSDGIVVTTATDTNSPAYRAGLRVNDIITKVNGDAILGSDSAVESFVAKVRNSVNTPLAIEVLRPSSSSSPITAINSKPDLDPTTLKLSVTPLPAGTSGKGAIGIGINARVDEVVNVVAKNPIEAANIGAEETWRLISFTWRAFSQSVMTGFAGSEVGGPVSVVRAGAQMAEYSPVALVGFAATLSVNLAILNSLPFPALDGGQLVFVLIELVIGRPVPRRVINGITGLAFSFLLALGASTLIGDVAKITEEAPAQSVIRSTVSGGERR